jgi:hypothetical protein
MPQSTTAGNQNMCMFMQLLSISEDTRIGKIKTEFNAEYPFLRIDFLRGNSLGKIRAEEFEKLNTANKIQSIDINKQRTVAEIKKDFKEFFGLTAEVFRKSGTVWIETSLTDDWTLEQQNREAEYLSINSVRR